MANKGVLNFDSMKEGRIQNLPSGNAPPIQVLGYNCTGTTRNVRSKGWRHATTLTAHRTDPGGVYYSGRKALNVLANPAQLKLKTRDSGYYAVWPLSTLKSIKQIK